jgi:hypothetical protein
MACQTRGVQLTRKRCRRSFERKKPGGFWDRLCCILLLPALHLGFLSTCSWGEAPPEPTVDPVDLPQAARLLALARESSAQGDDFSAADKAETLLRQTELPAPLAAEAWRLVAKGFARYGTPAGWTKVLAASENMLKMRGLREDWRTDALRSGAAAATELRAHSQAELFGRALIPERGVTLLERCYAQLAVARSLWAQRAFAECRQWLTHQEISLAMLASANHLDRIRQLQDLRAERQLLWAKCVQMEGLHISADLLLAELPSMPGQTSVSGPARESICLLQRREPPGGPRRIQRVLFVGSSHTIRGNLPCLVEQIAASAPPDRVRITAGEQTRMGTGMRAHWNDGVAHDAARGVIAAGGWDTVVVETFYRTSREDLLAFGSGYAEEVRRNGARLLIYETPVAKAIEYPAAYEAHHQTNVWLGTRLKSGVAPCVKAWMGVLGERPEPSAFEQLYADWIHASARGAYLSACCLYATLTGESPVGLWSPPGLLSPDEVLAYQRSAWLSFSETRRALERSYGETPP